MRPSHPLKEALLLKSDGGEPGWRVERITTKLEGSVAMRRAF